MLKISIDPINHMPPRMARPYAPCLLYDLVFAFTHGWLCKYQVSNELNTIITCFLVFDIAVSNVKNTRVIMMFIMKITVSKLIAYVKKSFFLCKLKQRWNQVRSQGLLIDSFRAKHWQSNLRAVTLPKYENGHILPSALG